MPQQLVQQMLTTKNQQTQQQLQAAQNSYAKLIQQSEITDSKPTTTGTKRKTMEQDDSNFNSNEPHKRRKLTQGNYAAACSSSSSSTAATPASQAKTTHNLPNPTANKQTLTGHKRKPFPENTTTASHEDNNELEKRANKRRKTTHEITLSSAAFFLASHSTSSSTTHFNTNIPHDNEQKANPTPTPNTPSFLIITQSKLYQQLNPLVNNQLTITTFHLFINQLKELIALAANHTPNLTFREFLTNFQASFTQLSPEQQTLLSAIRQLTLQLPGDFKTNLQSLQQLIIPFGEYQLTQLFTNEVKELGTAQDNGDCFYDTIAQRLTALNIKQNTGEPYNVKTLRMLCYNAIQHLPENNWVKSFVTQRAQETWELYQQNIQYTSDECSRLIQIPIWGQLQLEGKILMKLLGISLRQISIEECKLEYSSTGFITADSYYHVDEQDQLIEASQPINQQNLIELAIYRNHVMPIQPMTEHLMQNTQNNENEANTTVMARSTL
jgi:hypothetical protein